MNKALFDQMMARLGSSSMLPAPTADYAPGGAMFPAGAPVDPEKLKAAGAPQTLLGKAGRAIAPNAQMAMAGKGGAS